ncbi:MAG: GTPase HflX [Christensenellales bacterium]|jgi:GTP-binding protein HflX
MQEKRKINGNTDGIRNATLTRMLEMYDISSGSDFISPELVTLMAEYTSELNREISVYIARDGSVADISIGRSDRALLPEMKLTRGVEGLSGIRCIHTHPNGSGMLSPVDIGTLEAALMDAMASVGVRNGEPTDMYVGMLSGYKDGAAAVEIIGPIDPLMIDSELLNEHMALAMELSFKLRSVKKHENERAALIGIDTNEPYDSMAELAQLAETAEAEVVFSQAQKRDAPDNAYYIGKGKAEDLALMLRAEGVDVCIFNDELSAAQIRNLEELLGVKVIDRTALILDIFAGRAQSREGKLQVELAQLKYRLPRLSGMGVVLSRLGGGIGTRGPGEKKLEVDRRRIRRRIFELEREIEKLSAQRSLRRSRRGANEVPVIALVGYTNAGKSTLLNLLSGSKVLAEDKLFATLDPVTRQVSLPDKTDVLFVDTVGFINKLPHELVDAFKSTLEEAAYADVLLHVVDASSEYLDTQMSVVDDILQKLGAGATPSITILNKCDKNGDIEGHSSAIRMSAKTGEGLDKLFEAVSNELKKQRKTIKVTIPFTNGAIAAQIRRVGTVISEEYTEEGIEVEAMLSHADAARIDSMLKNS